MKKISDFNSATEKYPVIYAGSATRPEFVDMPTTLQQQEGVAPMDTLPAQWWNAMWKLATKDINAFRDYVGDAFTEINNLLTKFGITLDDADSEQLYDFFHNNYVQNYLNDIFVNKNGDTIDGDLHIKGNLSVDGIGEEIVSTELKVGANTITLRNGNPSALGNTELAGVVTENYDGNNHNNIISIDKNGVARTGDIDIATRILYSNNGTNFFTDEGLTIPATIGETEEVRDTGNQISGGVKIYEGITYSNNDTQPLATREENPTDGAFMKWDATSKKLVSVNLGNAAYMGVDTVVTADSENVPTSGAVNNALQGVIKEGSVINVAWINVESQGNVSGIECFFPGVDAGAFYSFKNNENPNDVSMNILSKLGDINFLTPSGKTAYLNGLPIATNEVIPAGTILPGMWQTAPKGFLLCDGTTYQTSQYPGLASVLGATGDTFKVPDLRECVLVGVGQNTTHTIATHDVYTLGLFRDDQLQTHTHSYSYSMPEDSKNLGPGSSGAKCLSKSGNSEVNSGRKGDTTHGKQFGVNYIIKY